MSSGELRFPGKNLILDALGVEIFARLQPELKLVQLRRGQVLYLPGAMIGEVYFPTTCLVSLLSSDANGASAGLAMVGNDGLTGIPVVLGGATSPYRAEVHSTGRAWRLRVEWLRWELEQGGELQRLALYYTQSLMAQMAQIALCNRHHGVEQQFCRWLLQSLDRLPDNGITMTQARIADLLGVRREAVVAAAGQLQGAGLIAYRRGHIAVLDRAGLEVRACECYRTIQAASQPAPLRPEVFASPLRPSPASLRKLALERLQDQPEAVSADPADIQHQMHELRVHQIELEIQNESLTEAFGEAQALHLHYADIYDFSPVAYVSIDTLGIIRQINLSGAILLGIRRSTALRHRFCSSVIEEDLPRFTLFLDDVLSGQTRKHCEIFLRPTPQRGATKVEIEATPDESGRECRMVINDITARHAYQAALEASEARYRQLIENLPLSLVIAQDGVVRLANSCALTLFGYSADDIVDHPFLPLIAAEDRDRVMAAHQLRMAGKDAPLTYSVRIHRRDGHLVACRLHASSVVWQGHVAALGLFEDVTEERQQREREQLLIAALEAVGNGVLITRTNGTIEWVNPAFELLTGYSRSEAIECRPADLIKSEQQDPALYERMWRTILAGEVWRGELVNRRKEGTLYNAELTIAPVRDEAGAISHFVGIQHNISRRKQLEADLRRLASTDFLTDLPNRCQFIVRMEEELARVQRNPGHDAMVLMLDLDHFKHINDRFGHAAGDTVLRDFARILCAELRRVDLAGRIGGEEFAVLLPDADMAAARIFAERLRMTVAGAAFSIRCSPDGVPATISPTVSIGIAALHAADTSVDLSLARADRALYQAKEAGRNCVAG